MDFLPSSFGFDPLGWTAGHDFASQVLWFDALVHNVDRTWRNPNLLVWHRNIWLIDHGAALWFHHNWPLRGTADPKRPFDAREHVLRDRATALADAADAARLGAAGALDAIGAAGSGAARVGALFPGGVPQPGGPVRHRDAAGCDAGPSGAGRVRR